jgi:hypothetical protein
MKINNCMEIENPAWGKYIVIYSLKFNDNFI